MSILTQSQTDLDSSISSLRRPRKSKSSSSSEVSKTYKHASQLYLTRRLAECYEALQPVIRPSDNPSQTNGNISASEDDTRPRAPIALASTSQRIKTWSLYAALLNAIIELGDEEGKQDFGSKQYREIVRNVQSSEVWEQVVGDGYMGRECSVDAEVVYNLSNLLLQKAQDQTVNQTRLETYLSSSPSASIDLSALNDSLTSNGTPAGSFQSNGLDTPKDLNSRIKILELFTLHVLPRNNEWDYARSFISNSDILDEERREAFAQTLTELQEAAEAQTQTEDEDLVGFADETETETEDEKIRMDENDNEEAIHTNGDSSDKHEQQEHRPRTSHHQRTSSAVDYGIDDEFLKSHIQNKQQVQTQSEAQSTATTKATSQRTLSPTPSAPPPSTSSAPSRPSTSPSAPQPTRKPSTAPTRRPPTNGANKRDTNKSTNNHNQKSGISKLFLILSNLTSTIATSLTRNPTQVFRTLMFLFAFLAVLARKDVRERLRRVVAGGWTRLSQTAGMGVKVSYV
ncbi:hypothetical protein OHC33_010553 [Knufia fluminis]|uniref:Peroxin 26 n=1 Tax=Knufia fluminis TaxID=191047 RepID=A0AAN8I2C2_9EURO|nr:hypothetical protein OHC33_010553 [Knufia fluminis]